MTSMFTLIVCGWLAAVPAARDAAVDDAAWKQLYQQAVNRPRRIIFNNDGNEPVYYCKQITKDDLLQARTTALLGSQVDSIFYCTWSSGFGLFTHNTKVGQIFNTKEAMFAPNRTQEFLDKGIDPLQVMVDFAHQHGIELFWSMRMNDTHDGSGAAYGPVMFRANRLKHEHPEWLIGSRDKRPRYGTWSAVDYGVPEIRDLVYRYCEEVCQNYAVDGIELDFFRHAFLFKSSGRGEACSQQELDQLTDLLRRIRTMTQAQGRKRNRPILLAIRVPDSVEYCRFIGIDLERWLADGLVDLLIAGGYTQLNPWEYSVQLGHRYGVKVYPSLDEPRIRDKSANALRASSATYRGRAMNVWSADADGVYMFNFFDPHSPLWHELGDPAVLRKRDRNYFASARGVGSVPVPHQTFMHVPTLNPSDPIAVAPQVTTRVEFRMGESFSDMDEHTHAVLRLLFKQPPDPSQFHATIRDKALLTGTLRDGWLEITLPKGSLDAGMNTLELSYGPQQSEKLSLLDLYVEITQR